MSGNSSASELRWTKAGPDQWVCLVPPDARFTLKAGVIGDGRWGWKIFAGAAENAMASGIVSSFGAAKQAMRNFMVKQGYV